MLILVLGGARSGKSGVAEELALRLPQPVTYLATLTPDPDDEDLAARIAAHQHRRPESWHTANAQRDLAAQLHELTGTVLLDSLGPWVAGQHPGKDALDGLCHAMTARSGDTVVVSDEVGLAVHPPTESGRVFRDNLGDANTAVAAVAQQTLLVVAGRIVSTSTLDADAVVRGGA